MLLWLCTSSHMLQFRIAYAYSSGYVCFSLALASIEPLCSFLILILHSERRRIHLYSKAVILRMRARLRHAGTFAQCLGITGDCMSKVECKMLKKKTSRWQVIGLERSPGRASSVMEWVPKRGEEGSVATACFTAGLYVGALCPRVWDPRCPAAMVV